MCDVIAARWIPPRLPLDTGSILNLPRIPKLGSSSIHLRPLFTASAKCISQPSNDGMAWHEVQQVFFESVFLVRVREQERRANEPPITCEVVSILKKQAGRPFVIPCASSWCEQKCVKIHRAIKVRVKCANFHSKKPLIRKVSDSRRKRPIQLSQNPFDGTLSRFKSCSRM